MSSVDGSGELIEDARGGAGEGKRLATPRKRGLGRGLGAILSTPDPADGAEGDGVHPAHHDPLTGLPGRALLDVRLEHALAACRQDDAVLAVLVVALDGFSKVNEVFGHRVGDDLLQGVAERMSAARRRSDTVARFAGDEFVVVCPYVGSAELACALAERVLEDVSRPCAVDGVEHHLTASVGVVVTATGDVPDDTEMLETLLGDAVLAMRTAKEDGGASWRLFDPTMRTDAADRYQYRQDLRAAMENGELVLEYEQIVELASRRAVGQSARPGWERSGFDDGPEVLLDVVDDAGLAVPVGRWVLDEALSALAARRSTSGVPAEFRVWVKVSPSFAVDPALVETVDELTVTHGIPAAMLGLDITEPSALSLATAAPALDALAGRGVAIMLDDFGASPSNLALLQRLPITGLKLAPEVVAGLDDADDDTADGDAAPDDSVAPGPDGAALVRGLVGLGRALGLTVVAQGVTSEFQVATLRSLGCDFAQGPFLENATAIDSGTGGARRQAERVAPPERDDRVGGTTPGARRTPATRAGLRPVPDDPNRDGGADRSAVEHAAADEDDRITAEDPTVVPEDPTDLADDPTGVADDRTAVADRRSATDARTTADDPNREDGPPPGPAAEPLWATGPTDMTGQTAPARDDPAPARDDPAPARDDPAPARDDPAPARDDPAPARDDPAPARDDRVSAPVQLAPVAPPPPDDSGPEGQGGREPRVSPSHPARLRRLQ